MFVSGRTRHAWCLFYSERHFAFTEPLTSRVEHLLPSRVLECWYYYSYEDNPYTCGRVYIDDATPAPNPDRDLDLTHQKAPSALSVFPEKRLWCVSSSTDLPVFPSL